MAFVGMVVEGSRVVEDSRVVERVVVGYTAVDIVGDSIMKALEVLVVGSLGSGERSFVG